MATLSPNAARNAAATAGVSAISGTSTSTDRPAARTTCARRRYTSVLPDPGHAVQQRHREPAREDPLLERVEGQRLLAGQDPLGVGRPRVPAALHGRERIAFDALAAHRHEPAGQQALDRVRRHAPLVQGRQRQAISDAAEQLECLTLPGP